MPKARRGGSGSMRQRLQAQLAKKLSFTRYDSAFIRVSDKGSVCTCVKPQPSTAVVSLPVMSTGRHYAEFTLVAGLKGTVGVCRAGLFDPESTAGGVMATNWGWGFVALAGDGDHSQQQYRWKGQRGSAQPPPPRTVSPRRLTARPVGFVVRSPGGRNGRAGARYGRGDAGRVRGRREAGHHLQRAHRGV